jgi:hypothetical protein
MPKINKYLIKKKEEPLYYNLGDWVKLNNAYVYSQREMEHIEVGFFDDYKFVKVKSNGVLIDLS